jgi:hypothetical protein
MEKPKKKDLALFHKGPSLLWRLEKGPFFQGVREKF